MSASVFDDKSIKPDDNMLAAELGATKTFFDKICMFIYQEFGEVTPEWKFYGQQSGWTLKLLNKKRNVLFIGPRKGYFLVTFIFGDKAVEKVMLSNLPDPIKTRLSGAKKYAEGRGISLEINTYEDLQNVLQLISIKLQ